MKRAIITLSAVCVLLGCQSSRQQFGPWAMSGQERIPPPRTGSIGPAVTAPPYYQSAPPSQLGVPGPLGTSTLPTSPNGTGNFGYPAGPANQYGAIPPRFTTAPSLSLPSSVNSPAVTEPETPAGNSVSFSSQPTSTGQTTTVNGWRSPQRVIQRANVQVPSLSNQVHVPPLGDRTATPSIRSSSSFSPPALDPSVLVSGPVQIVEPASSRPAATVAVRPMPVNDATRMVTEPGRFRAPKQLTEITNLPVARHSIVAVPNDYGPLQSTPSILTQSVPTARSGSGQWQSTTPRISRAQ